MKKGIDKFSKRLDEIFDQGMPTKVQIIDAYNKFHSKPGGWGRPGEQPEKIAAWSKTWKPTDTTNEGGDQHKFNE